MKTLFSIFFSINCLIAIGQSLQISPNGTENYKIMTGDQKGLYINSGVQSMGTYINSTSGWLQTHSDQDLDFVGGGARFGVKQTCSIEYNFPYKLGSDAPAIFSKIIFGTTASTVGGLVSVIPAGLNFANILSMNLIVDCGAAGYVPYNYSYTSGYQVNFFTSNTSIIIRNAAGNSANILNKPFKIYITYSN